MTLWSRGAGKAAATALRVVVRDLCVHQPQGMTRRRVQGFCAIALLLLVSYRR